MKSDRDTPDEFFEYEAEEFLVALALLITEGRTPEYSAKGRIEGIHCPPTKSSQPLSVKHECSDKLAQCRQARRIRSETLVLWKNNSSLMVEVMLLPDCCYSDEEPTTEGSDIKDPAIKQDALLLERWLLEPVPRQSGDRIIEEKTLLLAVRSFVFFSQLSAWLSVSNGAVPRNIMYRVSAADAELQWTFSQPPTEHVFPVPNVSHNVALKVSVQSLPRQSNYPVLNCSIHTNLGFYEKRIQKHERSTRKHCVSVELEPHTLHSFGKPVWTMAPERLMHTRTLSHDSATSPRNGKVYPVTSHRYDTGISNSTTLSGKNTRVSKTQLNGTPLGDFKSSFVLPHVPSTLCPAPPMLEASPLIGALLQERQEVIARIAQHLIHCDPPSSHLTGLPFNLDDAASVHSKRFWNSSNGNVLQNEPSFSEKSKLYSFITEEDSERKIQTKPHTPSGSCRPDGEPKTSPKPPARRKLFLAQHSKQVNCTFPQSFNKTTTPRTCTTLSSSTGNALEREGTLVSDRSQKEKLNYKDTSKHCPNCKNSDYVCFNKCKKCTVPGLKSCTYISSNLHLKHSETREHSKNMTAPNAHLKNHRCLNEDSKNTNLHEHKIQLISIENYFNKDNDSFKCAEKPDTLKTLQDENEDPGIVELLSSAERNLTGNRSIKCERLKHENVMKTIPIRHSAIWRKPEYRSLDGTSTNAFNPRTGLPLLSSPVPQRKTKSGHFDLDTSVLQFKSVSTISPQQYLNAEDTPDPFESCFSTSAPPVTSLCLLGNFEESVLNYRLEPLGIVDGFTADVGASGLFCPTHMTLPVEVSFYSVSDDNAPSPYMGVITLESLGKRGYRVPPSGTIQVTLFNPNKTVVKMFVVIYDLREMPASQQTFLRQRTFSVPVNREINGNVNEENILQAEEKTLRYLIHLRFQSSKSGKIYLHRDVRLLFSRKSMEVDSGAAYKLKSYTESPTNPQFSPRC